MSNDTQIPWDDPTTAPFWRAAAHHELLVQRCNQCHASQLYPRPFCLNCEADELSWVQASGTGTIYSQTTVHIEVVPELEPPYSVALVELDEGPRLLTHVVGEAQIGDSVTVAWRERPDSPPLPVFERVPDHL